MVEKSQEKIYFMTHENYMTFKFQSPQTKSYWNPVMSTLFHIICDYGPATVEWSSFHRDPMTH